MENVKSLRAELMFCDWNQVMIHLYYSLIIKFRTKRLQESNNVEEKTKGLNMYHTARKQ